MFTDDSYYEFYHNRFVLIWFRHQGTKKFYKYTYYLRLVALFCKKTLSSKTPLFFDTFVFKQTTLFFSLSLQNLHLHLLHFLK